MPSPAKCLETVLITLLSKGFNCFVLIPNHRFHGYLKNLLYLWSTQKLRSNIFQVSTAITLNKYFSMKTFTCCHISLCWLTLQHAFVFHSLSCEENPDITIKASSKQTNKAFIRPVASQGVITTRAILYFKGNSASSHRCQSPFSHQKASCPTTTFFY